MKQQKGFSLIQVLIVAGMLSGLFVVSLKVMKNQGEMGRNSSEEFEISYAFDDLKNLLSNRAVCKRTLSKINLYESSKLDGVKIGSEDSSFEYQPFEISGKKYGQNNLKIKSLKYFPGDDESSLNDGEAFIKVEFEKSRSALGSRIVEKKMKIHIQLDSKNIISSCYSLPGVNESAKIENRNAKVWHNVAGSEDIYINNSLAGVNTNQGSTYFGLALKGPLKIGSDNSPCSSERFGELRYTKSSLEYCSQKKVWKSILNFSKNKNHSKEFFLKASIKKRSHVITTKSDYVFCTISKNNLYGARCKSKRLSGNLWELSLNYERGKESSCVFRCFR